ncbi:MAG TPA: glycosyltransferase family 4 protein [Candidatus Elarobacter sp.]|jgi:glycosyltransferase involved in cell wall biosynthesis|nr:glycosyltransferase family 4 protein [Candidatus Elarobacter sp.]
MRAVMVLCDRVGDVGGAERYWETVLPALASSGLRVRVLARRVDATARFGFGARELAWSGEDAAPSADAARAVAEEIRRERPDAVVTASVFDPAVLDAVRAEAARWIVRVHDHRAFCPTGDRVYPQFEAPCSAAMGAACRAATFARGCVHGPRPSSFRRIAAREALRDRIARADAVLVSSEHMFATCTANGLDGARIAITPPPLPDDAYVAAPVPRPRERRLLFASRLTPRKGLRSLLRALARLGPDERPLLVVAGEGEAEERAARAQAARDGVAVEWRGKLSAGQLRAAIDAADAVAVPSLWPEPFGLVGIEAQARGRPAVAYDAGGIGDWIARAGIAVRRGDEAALATAIRTIASEPAWSGFASAARERAEEYRLGAHAERLIGILQGERKAA